MALENEKPTVETEKPTVETEAVAETETVADANAAADANAVADVKAAAESEHRISNNALRWILFVLTLGLIGLGSYITSMHTSFTSFGTTLDANNIVDFIRTTMNGSGKTGGEMFKDVMTLFLSVAWVIGLIIALIRAILLFVCFFGFLTGAKSRKRTLRRFRSAEKNLAHLVGYFLVLDFLLSFTGTPLGASFILEAIVLFVLILANALNRELYDELAGEGFNWRRFFPEMAFMLVYCFIFVLVILQFKGRPLFTDLVPFVDKMGTLRDQALSNNIIWFILCLFGTAFTIAAMIIGSTMLISFAAYYPYNDQKKDDEKVRPRVQGSLLTKGILLFVFSVVPAVLFYMGSLIEGIPGIINFALLPLIVLLMVIAMRVAYNLDHPVLSDEEEEAQAKQEE